MIPRKLMSFALFCTTLISVTTAQNRLTAPIARFPNTDITTDATGSYCGSLAQSVQANPAPGNIYYQGDSFSVSYKLQTATTANINVGLIQYSSLGTTTVLPTVATYTPLASVASQQATTTPATVSSLALPNVLCLNPGDCAIAWMYDGATKYYSCADVYILSRADDATITFHVNRGTASVPLGTTLRTRFLNYFNTLYGTFRDYNVRGPNGDPVADSGGNYLVTFTMSDGAIGWVNAQNMSYQVQYEVNNDNAAVTASIFGAGTSITGLDVDDSATRAKASSTSGTAIALIVIFLILVAALLGVLYYYWKYQPAKLRSCMERACPCFMGGSSGAPAKQSTYMTSTAQPAPGTTRPGAPTSAPPNRAQINI